MAGTPERKIDPLSRRLHNFTFPTNLSWGNRRTQSSTSYNTPTYSASILNQQSRSPFTASHRSPTTPVIHNPVNLPKADKEKFVITTTTFDRGLEELEAIRQKLLRDLKVSVGDRKLGFPGGKGKGNVEEKRAVEDVCPCNLQNRGGVGRTTNETGETLWPVPMVYRRLLASDRGESSGGREPERNNFSRTLTEAEIEADFLQMTVAKPPKKISKATQKEIDGMFPGAWLDEVAAKSYKVHEMPGLKKK